ncbi:MAG: hypothetical protein ACTHLD_12450 [Chitinophaga sp.]
MLGNLYTDIDDRKALQHYETALKQANTPADAALLEKNIGQLKRRLKQ